MASDQITTTKEAIAAAFDEWETSYRKDPKAFMTAEEQAAIEVAPLSEARAIYLCALLRAGENK